jgi:prefoldin subunit 5
LLRVFRDPESSVEQVSEKLQAYRKARQQVQDELEKAVEELRKLLTLRQQAIFMIQGILD